MEEKKLTVEQVKAAANEQIAILYNKLQEANLNNTFKRLDYLFSIIKCDKFSNNTIDRAIKEIEHIVLGIPESIEKTPKVDNPKE